MTELEQAIDAIEHGLLAVTRNDERLIRKMDLDTRMAYHQVPGISIALVDQGELAWAKGYGVMEAGGVKPVTTESIFQAASISKTVTAMVALHLVEAGLLNLDADANDMMHSWKIPESKYTQVKRNGMHPIVTLRGLLSHTAWINVRGYSGYTSERQLPTLQQILKGEPPANSRPVRVMQAPGKAFRYSGGGYVIVQQMIEDVTGRCLADLAQEFIFDKLGMTNSTFHHLLPEGYIAQAATAHRPTEKPVPGKWHVYPENAPASLWTTPSDLARLVVEVIRSYHNESNLVLSAKMTREMFNPQVNIGVGWDCGLAFNIVQKDGMTRFGHPGWNVGFHSIMLVCLEAGQGLIWMTNGENGRQLGLEISCGLSEVVSWSWW